MRRDITAWCRACLTCATHQVGKAVRPCLTPIPVGGPFDRLGVDVLHLPLSKRGNKYAVVFMDYLTKWPEVFPAKDQSAYTIAKLLVENIITRHGVPRELLSDREAAFLSGLMKEVYRLMGIHKANTTAYHPQTDGRVWDERVSFVLFAYRASPQQSTGESPFFQMYGRDPVL